MGKPGTHILQATVSESKVWPQAPEATLSSTECISLRQCSPTCLALAGPLSSCI